MAPFRFEDGLARLFAFERGNNLLTLLALAERARFSQRFPDWLTRKADGSVRRKFTFDWLGPQWIKDIASFWEVLRAGSARDIEGNVRALISSDRHGSDLKFALRNLLEPLALLERSQVAAELHDEMLNHGIQITLQTGAHTCASRRLAARARCPHERPSARSGSEHKFFGPRAAMAARLSRWAHRNRAAAPGSHPIRSQPGACKGAQGLVAHGPQNPGRKPSGDRARSAIARLCRSRSHPDRSACGRFIADEDCRGPSACAHAQDHKSGFATAWTVLLDGTHRT